MEDINKLDDDIWDLKNMVGFRCSTFTWSKDKRRIRIWIPSKKDVQEAGVTKEYIEHAPEQSLLLEFGKRDTEALKLFFKMD